MRARETWPARSSSSSVVVAHRGHDDADLAPVSAVATTRRATRVIRSGSATEVPPYFWTTTVTGLRS